MNIRLITLGMALLFATFGAIASSHHMARYPGEFYALVSTSMPQQSLKQWVKQGKEFSIPVVLRGFVGNSFKETVTAFKKLDVHGGFNIDPVIFNEFNVEKVPALVYQRQESRWGRIVYGNVSIRGALEEMCDRRIQKACEKLRR